MGRPVATMVLSDSADSGRIVLASGLPLVQLIFNRPHSVMSLRENLWRVIYSLPKLLTGLDEMGQSAATAALRLCAEHHSRSGRARQSFESDITFPNHYTILLRSVTGCRAASSPSRNRGASGKTRKYSDGVLKIPAVTEPVAYDANPSHQERGTLPSRLLRFSSFDGRGE
jgi:hypothetical protein